MLEPVLRLADVQYTYKTSNFSLHCPALSLYAGESVLLLGKNGSGKTTLSKLLCGILRPDTGDLFLSGVRANSLPLGQIGRQVGYLFQEPARQLFATTVWEEMTIVSDLKGEAKESAAARATELLSFFGLLPCKERSVYRLSRGEQQRLALAAVLMQGARYLLLDEPTTGLDLEMRAKFISTVQSLLAVGCGVAIVTHDRALIEAVGGRRVLVEDGEVRA